MGTPNQWMANFIEMMTDFEEIFRVDIPDDIETLDSPCAMREWLEPRLANWGPGKQAAAVLRKLAKDQQRPELADGLDRAWRREQIDAVIRDIFRELSPDDSSGPSDPHSPVRAPLKPKPHLRSGGAAADLEREEQRDI
jgi:hypothetical protein